MSLLLGDIGGTKAEFALFSNDSFIKRKKYLCRNFGSLSSLLNCVRRDFNGYSQCVIGAAGPVRKGICKMTNLSWTVAPGNVAKLLGLKAKQVSIVNDFEAVAWGILCLSKNDTACLRKGKVTRFGSIAVLGPGTGLGESFIKRNLKMKVIPTEFGHHPFFASNDTEEELLSYLLGLGKKNDTEHLVSGPGLSLMYLYFSGRKLSPEMIVAKVRKRDVLAKGVIDLFLSLLAKEAGILAMRAKATGGVYICGNLVRNLAPFLKKEEFVQVFDETTKKRMRNTPLLIVKNPDVSLIGLRYIAMNG